MLTGPTKRVLLIVLAFLLFFGGAFLVYRLIAARRTSSQPDSSRPRAEELLPDGDVPSSPLPPVTTEDQPRPAFSLACPDAWSGLGDRDTDGLPDPAEDLYGTAKENPDTDGDGYTDGEEVRSGFDPRQSLGNPRLDMDADGLLDHDECRWKTDPQNPDTDGDGFGDGDEVRHKYDPTRRGDGQGSDALPERRALAAEMSLEEFRPRAASDNLTERLAAELFGSRPISELNAFSPPPEDIQRSLDQFPRNTALPDVSISDLSVGRSNTPADLRAYLDAITRAEPLPADATTISSALSTAFRGEPTTLRTLRLQLEAYDGTLRALPVPPTAVTYHRKLVGFVRFTLERFRTVETTGTTDPARAYLALRELQDGAAAHAQRLAELRAELEQLAAPAAPAAE